MSGYDPKTNIFELTAKKMRLWLRRQEIPENMTYDESSCDNLIIQLFRHFDIEIIHDGGNFMVVRGTPEQIWEALSGQPSVPDQAEYHHNYGDSNVNHSKYLDKEYIPILNDCRRKKYEGLFSTKKELCEQLGLSNHQFDKQRREKGIKPFAYTHTGKGIAYFYMKADWL